MCCGFLVFVPQWMRLRRCRDQGSSKLSKHWANQKKRLPPYNGESTKPCNPTSPKPLRDFDPQNPIPQTSETM